MISMHPFNISTDEHVPMKFIDFVLIKTLAPGWFWRFLEKKRLNARGFAQKFLRSGMLYRPGKSLKRRNESSSLHSKKNFLLGGCRFFVSDVRIEDF